MQRFPRGGSNLKRWPFWSRQLRPTESCVCAGACGVAVFWSVCVSSGGYLFASVCLSVRAGLCMCPCTHVCVSMHVCVSTRQQLRACPQAGKQLGCEFPEGLHLPAV